MLPRCFSTWCPPWPCSVWTRLVAVLAWALPSSGPFSLRPAPLSVGTVLCIKPSGLTCNLDYNDLAHAGRHFPKLSDIFSIFFLLGVTAPSISFCSSSFSSPKWSSTSSWLLASLDGGSGTTNGHYFLLLVFYLRSTDGNHFCLYFIQSVFKLDGCVFSLTNVSFCSSISAGGSWAWLPWTTASQLVPSWWLTPSSSLLRLPWGSSCWRRWKGINLMENCHGYVYYKASLAPATKTQA